MDVPASFWKLCRHFHQDVFSFTPAGKPQTAPESPLVDYLVGSLTREEQASLADFLEWMLIQPDAGIRLMELWNKSQADFRFAPANEIAELFATIRSRL